MKLWLDRETFSEDDLKEVGTYQYAATAEDLLVSYAIDDGEVKVWDCTTDDEIPTDLYNAMTFAGEVWAHNAAFDKAVHNGPAQCCLPRIALTRWRCSMALALSHALPGALDNLCEVLRIPAEMAKLKEGKKLVQLFTRPQPANRKIRRADRYTHPAEWERFKAYAANDISAMREAVNRMPEWNWDDSVIAEWHRDQRMNERGFYVDRALVQAGARAAIVEKERIGVRFRELTGGVVDRPSQREQFKTYIDQRFGLELEDTTKDTFQHLIKTGRVEGVLKELMELSMASNKTSTAKYAKLEPMVQADCRFRGAIQFAGAGRTRRDAGRGPQFQNLPSRGLPDAEDVERYIEHLKMGSHDLFFDDLMLYGSAALRGTVTPPPGKKLAVADLANIEGRMLSWVSSENWKLAAFREYDAGTGPDLYNVTASSILGGDPWKVSKKDRNVFGKVPDLASGYQGGVAGYQTFAHAYGVRMADYWDTIQKQIAPALVEKAKANLDSWGRESQLRLEISELEWIASETCKLAWRARHPATVKFWYDLQDAAKSAIRNWGTVFNAGRYIKVRCVNHMGQRWMVVKLPSGRFLTYFDPQLTSDGSLSYMGESAEEGKTTRQWIRVFTHGGKMTGNVCQTLARDILIPALQVAEDRGYLPVLAVHDEAITEVPDTDEFSAGGLIDILATNPAWADGLPLAAAGFEAYRYKKD
jgi:DNA polymerase